MKYLIKTESGHTWLIENAESETDALEQYYDGGAETHQRITAGCDDETAEYCRDIGQAT